MARLLVVLAAVALAGCSSRGALPPELVEVSLNSTTPLFGAGPVAIWVFLPESARACSAGVAVGMMAFGDGDVFGSIALEEQLANLTGAAAFLVTRFAGEGPESSAQFYPPKGTKSVLVYVEQGRVADPVVYSVENATWHEKTVSGWERMPSAAASLRAPCAVEVE